MTTVTTILAQLFHEGGRYYIETSPLICSANQWTGFYMITASVMKELMQFQAFLTICKKIEKLHVSISDKI